MTKQVDYLKNWLTIFLLTINRRFVKSIWHWRFCYGNKIKANRSLNILILITNSNTSTVILYLRNIWFTLFVITWKKSEKRGKKSCLKELMLFYGYHKWRRVCWKPKYCWLIYNLILSLSINICLHMMVYQDKKDHQNYHYCYERSIPCFVRVESDLIPLIDFLHTNRRAERDAHGTPCCVHYVRIFAVCREWLTSSRFFTYKLPSWTWCTRHIVPLVRGVQIT